MSHRKSRSNHEELEIEVAVESKKPPNRVIEGAVVRRRDVLLNIARIEVVNHVVNAQPSPKLDVVTAKCEVDRVLEFRVHARKAGKRPALFSWPMKFQS